MSTAVILLQISGYTNCSLTNAIPQLFFRGFLYRRLRQIFDFFFVNTWTALVPAIFCTLIPIRINPDLISLQQWSYHPNYGTVPTNLMY
jgi:hypothetical protein